MAILKNMRRRNNTALIQPRLEQQVEEIPASYGHLISNSGEISLSGRTILQEPQIREEGQTGEQASEITREQLSLRKRLLQWRTLLPLVLVIGAMIFAVTKANINVQKTWTAIQEAQPAFLLAAFIIYYLSFGLRAWRWRVLLENVGYTKEKGISIPGFWRLTKIVYISFFANAVVPAKLGDLYRAYLLRQEIGVSTTRSFGTVLAERLLDLVVLLLLFIPAFLFSFQHQHMPAELTTGMKILMGVVIIGIGALFFLHLRREAIAAFIPLRYRDHYYHFQEGTLGSFHRLPGLIGLTICIWSCEALRFFFIALALGLITGNVFHIAVVSLFIGLGEALLTVIPATGGGVGLVEGGMAAMIVLFNHGYNALNQAAAAIIIDRVISFFSILFVGTLLFIVMFSPKNTGKSI